MALSVSCAYARVAVKELFNKHSEPHKGLPQGAFSRIHSEFMELFPQFQIDLVTARKRFLAVKKVFRKKWHPDDAKKRYLSTFAITSWENLPESEKREHTLRDCRSCTTHYGSLYNLFPTGKIRSTKENTITVTINDQSTIRNAGKYILQKIGPFVEQQTGSTLQDILVNTPESKLTYRPTSNKKLAETRKIEREFRSKVETEYRETDASLVMGNRISWSTYDKIRKAEVLQKKRKENDNAGNTRKRRKHGADVDNLLLDNTDLLEVINL